MNFFMTKILYLKFGRKNVQCNVCIEKLKWFFNFEVFNWISAITVVTPYCTWQTIYLPFSSFFFVILGDKLKLRFYRSFNEIFSAYFFKFFFWTRFICKANVCLFLCCTYIVRVYTVVQHFSSLFYNRHKLSLNDIYTYTTLIQKQRENEGACARIL